ncbi:MAG: histidine--tRNA ligase [Solirubrobacterales bacterium]
MEISAPKGTFDILPDTSYRWQALETVLGQLAERYGYREVRTPIFEHTELFKRGVGDTTDIVQKEMYTFLDKAERSLTLRPEGTAPAARAFLENGLHNQALPAKWYYMGPMFRYDNTQAGRYRQFHQFGLEAFGSADPAIDAEIVALMVRMVQSLGLTGTELHLNTVGCPSCRPQYRDTLVEFLTPRAAKLCSDCQHRYQANPLRVLDCKNESCQAALEGYPVLTDSVCPDCHAHFETVRDLLGLYGIAYRLNNRLVRGLDYYTKTAFELQLTGIGAQSAVGGGGRYDGLIETIGGPATPGIGFALGIDRLLLALENQSAGMAQPAAVDVFVIAAGERFVRNACQLLDRLRAAGIKSDKDYMGRSLKAQMKFADKTGARWVLILGEDEIRDGYITVRDMKQQAQEKITDDRIVAELRTRIDKA